MPAILVAPRPRHKHPLSSRPKRRAVCGTQRRDRGNPPNPTPIHCHTQPPLNKYSLLPSTHTLLPGKLTTVAQLLPLHIYSKFIKYLPIDGRVALQLNSDSTPLNPPRASF